PSDQVRIGMIGGLRPDAANLDVDTRHAALSLYGSGKHKSDDAQVYLAMGGLMTWLNNAPDRHAAFTDVRLTLGKVFTLFASSELDLYGASDTFRSGIGLTRLSVSARVQLGIIGFRAFFSQSQLPDTKAQRQINA